MLDDKDLDKMLNAYRVPALDPDVVTQAMHNALRTPVEIQKPKRGFRFVMSPFPAFMMGGAVAVAAMVLVILPLTGLQISPEQNIDAVVNELVVSQQVAENDIKSADEILSLISSRNDKRSRSVDDILNDRDEDAPIWDTFMGRS